VTEVTVSHGGTGTRRTHGVLFSHKGHEDHEDVWPFDWAARRPDVMYESPIQAASGTPVRFVLASRASRLSARASRADQSNGPSFVSVSPFLL